MIVRFVSSWLLTLAGDLSESGRFVSVGEKKDAKYLVLKCITYRQYSDRETMCHTFLEREGEAFVHF